MHERVTPRWLGSQHRVQACTVVLCSIVLAVSLGACGDDEPIEKVDPPTVSVTGTVQDAANGSLIPGVIVHFLKLTHTAKDDTTGVNGEYEVEVGYYLHDSLRFTRVGYDTLVVALVGHAIVDGQDNTLYHLDVELVPAGVGR
jgi:hypothetical protein